MSDTISRQDAIEAVQNRHMLLSKEKTLLIDDLEKLPPVQPEIIRCKDCKYNYGLTHDGEFNPEDIVCTYFDTDGMQCYDFCSYAERKEDVRKST